MSHFVRCDRCAREEYVMGTVTMPPGWQKIMSADLCEPCCMIVRDFIKFKPSDAEALPVEPVPNEPPPAPAADGTKLFETTPEVTANEEAKPSPAPTAPDSQAPHEDRRAEGSQTNQAMAGAAVEISAEERAREKKRKKMRGQNAILPDQRPPQPGAQP